MMTFPKGMTTIVFSALFVVVLVSDCYFIFAVCALVANCGMI